jgi:hypothetical protein
LALAQRLKTEPLSCFPLNWSNRNANYSHSQGGNENYSQLLPR